MDYWPWGLLPPKTDRWVIHSQAVMGGTSVGGIPRLGRIDAGGLWIAEQTFLLAGRDRIKAARAIEATLDGGVGKIVAFSYERPFSPGTLTSSSIPHSDGAAFGDGSLYLSAPDGAVTTEAAALRATRLKIEMLDGIIQAGENFSITHETKGIRRYRVARVFGDEIDIRPPLREAIPANTGLNFIRVGCVCRLVNAQNFLSGLDAADGGEIAYCTAQWVEAF